ncbi:MAG: cell division protein FtsL [Sedimenticola sp.]
MSRGRFLVLVLTALALLVTAMSVVYAKYSSRKNFVELQQLRSERDRMDIEWGRLQLEQRTRATHVRIEQIARKRLKMHIPTAGDVMVIRPSIMAGGNGGY